MKRKIICILVLGLLFLTSMTVGKPGDLQTLSYSGWDARITATFSQGSDDTIFSIMPDATSGFDSAYDLPEPLVPVEPPYVQAYFRYPGNAPLPTRLHRSCIPPENIMEWPLRVSYRNGTDNITLSWNLENVPADYAVRLYKGENLVADMKAVDNYTFEAATGEHDFTIATRIERAELPSPTSISPPNGVNITDNTPLFDWSDVSDLYGVTYDLSIARDAGFASIALQKIGLSTSTYELTPAEALAIGTYYWRARAVDGAGNVSSWSENWSFTVSIAPPTPPPPSVEIPLITPEAPARVEVENTAITVLEISVLHTVENFRITIQELIDRPAEIAIAAPGAIYRYLEIIEENITDNDVSSVTITFKVEKTWIEGENIDENTITLKRYNAENGEWVSLPTVKIDEDATYVYFSVTSPRLSYFAISGTAISPAPAAFTVSILAISPLQVSVGEEVGISVTVKNTGDFEGTYTVTLKINGAVEAIENVTVAGESERPVTFTVTRDVEGTYNVEVDGLTGGFSIIAPPPPGQPWAIVTVLLLAAMVIVSVAVYRARIVKRRLEKRKIICILVLGLLFLAPMTAGMLGDPQTLSHSVWDARITTTFSQGSDDAIFGVMPDATSGFDSSYDIPEPPVPVEPPYVQAFFYYPGNAPQPTRLHRSCIQPENLMEWPLRISYSGSADNITLSWNIENIPAEYFIHLLKGENLMADMRVVDNYTFQASAGDHDFTIRVCKIRRGVGISISPSYQSGLPGATLTYLVTVKNTGNVEDNFSLWEIDSLGWAPELDNTWLIIPPSENEVTTLSVIIPSDVAPSTEDNIIVAAISQGDPNVRDNDWCIAHVLKAEFGLVTLYKVSLDLDIWLNQGSRLVVKFYTWGGVYQSENVVWSGATPDNVSLSKIVPHPENQAVENVKLDLTYENTENVISTIASFTVRRSSLMTRIGAIKGEWPYADAAKRTALMTEIGGIKGQWPYAPA